MERINSMTDEELIEYKKKLEVKIAMHNNMQMAIKIL